MKVLQSMPIPKIQGGGRPKGSGPNMKMLARMKPGNCIVEVPFNKMQSIKSSAFDMGCRIRIRRMPDSSRYFIWKL